MLRSVNSAPPPPSNTDIALLLVLLLPPSELEARAGLNITYTHRQRVFVWVWAAYHVTRSVQTTSEFVKMQASCFATHLTYMRLLWLSESRLFC